MILSHHWEFRQLAIIETRVPFYRQRKVTKVTELLREYITTVCNIYQF